MDTAEAPVTPWYAQFTVMKFVTEEEATVVAHLRGHEHDAEDCHLCTVDRRLAVAIGDRRSYRARLEDAERRLESIISGG